MTAAEKLDLPPMTFADFVEFERTSDVKHEIWGGVLVAMAGATERHNIVAGNAKFEIESQFRASSSGCMTFGSDQMVYQPGPNKGVYPDLSAVCGPGESEKDSAGENRVLLNPGLAIEVLSRSTAGRDFGGKLDGYFSIPSLTEYIVIDPTFPSVRIHRVDGTELRMSFATDLDDTIELQSLNVTLAVRDIYHVDLSPRSDIFLDDDD